MNLEFSTPEDCLKGYWNPDTSGSEMLRVENLLKGIVLGAMAVGDFKKAYYINSEDLPELGESEFSDHLHKIVQGSRAPMNSCSYDLSTEEMHFVVEVQRFWAETVHPDHGWLHMITVRIADDAGTPTDIFISPAESQDESEVS